MSLEVALDEKKLAALARLCKLLSDPNRLRILLVIAAGKKAVRTIVRETGLPQTLVSFHLRPLRESGLVVAERQGPFVYYRLAEPVLTGFLEALSRLPAAEAVTAGGWPPPGWFQRRLD